MATSFAAAAAVLLTSIALLHIYWGLGGLWPGNDVRDLVRTVVGAPDHVSMPGFLPCLAVAVGLGVAAAAALVSVEVVPGPTGAASWVVYATMAILSLRGIGGYFDGWLRPWTREQPFYRLNRTIYSALCLCISTLLALGSLP